MILALATDLSVLLVLAESCRRMVLTAKKLVEALRGIALPIMLNLMACCAEIGRPNVEFTSDTALRSRAKDLVVTKQIRFFMYSVCRETNFSKQDVQEDMHRRGVNRS